MGVVQDGDKAIDNLKTLWWDNLIEGAVDSLAVLVPWAAPFFLNAIGHWITLEVFQWVGDKIYAVFRMLAIKGVIRLDGFINLREFTDADLLLKVLAIEKGVDSPEWKAQHEIEKAALKKLGQFSIVKP